MTVAQEGGLDDELGAAVDRLERQQPEAGMHPAARGHRRREPHPVDAVDPAEELTREAEKLGLYDREEDDDVPF